MPWDRLALTWACPHSRNWAWPQCQKSFRNKQAMRMHEVAKHKIMHIAHAFMPATNCPCCMREFHTKRRANFHLKTIKTCLPLLRFYAPGGVGYGKEVATGSVLAQQKANTYLKLNGPLRWPQSLPPGAVLPPAPPGYITLEDFGAMNQHHNQEQMI